MISTKITSLTDDSSINNEDNKCWREIRRKNRGSANMKQDTFMIPTIINSFQLLNLEENNYETSEERTEIHRIPAKARGKTVTYNKKKQIRLYCWEIVMQEILLKNCNVTLRSTVSSHRPSKAGI